MRKFLFFMLFWGGLVSGLWAQVQVADTSIVQYLQRPVGRGTVTIVQDARLSARLSRTNGDAALSASLGNRTASSYITVSGYRIQVFSDNNQRKSKDEAYHKAQLIRNADLDVETYVTFTSPFWRLRVGDFRTYEEADAKLRELKREFPSFAREMRIVRENVRIPQY